VLLFVGAAYLILSVLLVHNIIVTGVPPPGDPTEALRQCLEDPGKVILCIAAILAFDAVAIGSILIQVVKLTRDAFTLRRVLKTIFRDVTIYFLVIFASHLSVIISINIARPELKVLPAIGLEVMIPVMISRFTFALKRVAGKGQNWEEFTIKSFAARVPTTHTTHDYTSQRSSVLDVETLTNSSSRL